MYVDVWVLGKWVLTLQCSAHTFDLASFPCLPTHTGIWTKLCRWEEPGISSHVSSAKGRETLNCTVHEHTWRLRTAESVKTVSDLRHLYFTYLTSKRHEYSTHLSVKLDEQCAECCLLVLKVLVLFRLHAHMKKDTRLCICVLKWGSLAIMWWSFVHWKIVQIIHSQISTHSIHLYKPQPERLVVRGL